MGKTSIEWTDLSWPILNGCRRCSPGCEHCYAERLSATRLVKTPKYRGLAMFKPNGPQWTGESRLWIPDLDMPLRTRKPSRIFVADMGDLFYERNSDEEIAAVFGVMALACHHTFQVLTKRSARAKNLLSRLTIDDAIAATVAFNVTCSASQTRAIRAALPASSPFQRDSTAPLWPLPNVWIGASIENQKYADERIPYLLETPAAVRFLSVEPQLGPIDLSIFIGRPDADGHCTRCGLRDEDAGEHECPAGFGPRPDWIIQGGESGPGARPFDLAWARSMREQCHAAGVAYFFKQAGSNPREHVGAVAEELIRLRNRKGGDLSELPEQIRVRQFPEVARG
jgi:protein gp37